MTILKKIKKIKKISLQRLLILNILLTIILGTAFGIQFRVPPFDIIKDNLLKPLFKESKISIDKSVEKKIDIFWKEKEKLNENIDYYGGIDWKKYIYWAEEIKKGGYILVGLYNRVK